MKIAIVGSGLYGATVAALLKYRHEVTVFEKRNHIGGNVYTTYTPQHGHISEYGAHIFHTNSDMVWNFITGFGAFNSYQHYVLGKLPSGDLIDLPFTLSTFHKLLGIASPAELDRYLASLPQMPGDDLESHCISMVGVTVYEAIVKNYTEKQWGRSCSKLPRSIIQRLPVRLTHDRTYFRNAKYQGMPIRGYTAIIEKMLSGTSLVAEDVDSKVMEQLQTQYDHVFFSGQVDRLFDYKWGTLPYRGLRFDHQVVAHSHHQGAPVINDLTSINPWTRTIEHAMFYQDTARQGNSSIITREYPTDWKPGAEPYYPIRDDESTKMHRNYMDAAVGMLPKVTIGGRLGAYQYYDMDQVIAMAMKDARGFA